MQRAGPTRPIYSAIVEPCWPLLAKVAIAGLAHPVGAPRAAPAARSQLGQSASGAHLEQLWGKFRSSSGAVLEHPGVETGEGWRRDGEGWGCVRGGAGWGIVEATGGRAFECRRDPPGTLVGGRLGLLGHIGAAIAASAALDVAASHPEQGGCRNCSAVFCRAPSLRGPNGPTWSPRAPPAQSQCGQRARIQANADGAWRRDSGEIPPSTFCAKPGVIAPAGVRARCDWPQRTNTLLVRCERLQAACQTGNLERGASWPWLAWAGSQQRHRTRHGTPVLLASLGWRR